MEQVLKTKKVTMVSQLVPTLLVSLWETCIKELVSIFFRRFKRHGNTRPNIIQPWNKYLDCWHVLLLESTKRKDISSHIGFKRDLECI